MSCHDPGRYPLGAPVMQEEIAGAIFQNGFRENACAASDTEPVWKYAASEVVIDQVKGWDAETAARGSPRA